MERYMGRIRVKVETEMGGCSVDTGNAKDCQLSQKLRDRHGTDGPSELSEGTSPEDTWISHL